MEVTAFRIKDFRSIVDSGWVQLSPDGVTVFVGQNESGKTSVLQALYCALSRIALTPDDRRIDAPDPVVFLRIKTDYPTIANELDSCAPFALGVVEKFLRSKNFIVELRCEWKAKTGASALTEFRAFLDSPQDFEIAMREAEAAYVLDQAVEIESTDQETPDEVLPVPVTADTLADTIHMVAPGGTLFNAETGLLPNTVEFDKNDRPTGNGAIAAANFISIAEIDLPALLSGDGRYRQNVLNRANQRVSDDFSSFWSQLIGSKSKLSLKCNFEHYNAAGGDKAGKPYLEFWICDGNTQLYPKQRSQGVRWFISFYLQLRASEKTRASRIFLLDEPGANLHAKAQADVLRLIDRLKKEIPILYSTHSPQMIEYEKLFRIRAVQRDGEKEDSPTVIIDGHQLGAASYDTLSPILSAMGSDMASQSVVKKARNVILEEASGFYYLKSFWKLLGKKDAAHFIAATGVNKVPAMVSMFLGWGLDFVVAIDDDKQGREVFNQLKKDLFGDDEALARKQLLKFPGITSIEEVFSEANFKALVIRDIAAELVAGNAEYLKSAHLSKPVVAFQFWLRVESGEIKKSALDDRTMASITSVVDALTKILAARPT